QLQQTLSVELTTRGQEGVVSDGAYGKRTHGGIARLCDLADFRDLKVPESDPHFGAISFSIWDRLMPAVSPPTIHERAFVISLSHEGTDYDHAEWNFGTSDQESVLTWGPYGATVGHGGEVQAILRRVAGIDSRLVPEAFGNDSLVVKQLLDGKNGEELLQPVHADLARRERWL